MMMKNALPSLLGSGFEPALWVLPV